MQLYELFYSQLAEAAFCEQFCRIALACYLAEIDASETDGLLNAQRVCIQVPELAAALSVADTYSRAGIGPHAQACIYSKITE